MIEDARQQSPRLWNDVVAIADTVHPLELLCQMSLFLMHAGNDHPDAEKLARWQVRIELLAWHLLHRPNVMDPPDPLIGSSVLTPLEDALDRYFSAMSLAVMELDSKDREAEMKADLATRVKSEALHVRGEGLPEQVEELASGMYGAHSLWFTNNLGFTIEQAFAISKSIFDLVAEKLQKRKTWAQSEKLEALEAYHALVEGDPASLAEEDRQLRDKLLDVDLSEVVEAYGMAHMFTNLREAIGFEEAELAAITAGGYSASEVSAFLLKMSQELGKVERPPDPLGFNPLAERPLIRHDGRYYLPVPPALYDALLSTFHFDIMADAAYRQEYDTARAQWLEQRALDAFQQLLPGCSVHWSLSYGPKKARQELDGLVIYDNKVLFIECKWKSLTLSARGGNVEALEVDLAQSIVGAFNQAVRARDFLRASNRPVEFTDATGVKVLVDPKSVSQTYEVALTGRGGMAVLAANLPLLVSPASFPRGDYPWAISLIDLLIMPLVFDLPSQVFDYLAKRDAFVKDQKSLVHDEWDLLGLYFMDSLDMRGEQFADAHFVLFSDVDNQLEQYLRYLQHPNLAEVAKPARSIPDEFMSWLRAIDASNQPGRSDFILALLSLPDQSLQEVWKAFEVTVSRTLADKKLHSVAMLFGDLGIALLVGNGKSNELTDRMIAYCHARKYRNRAKTWLGFAVDVLQPQRPGAFTYLAGEWVHDDALEEMVEALLGPEANR